VLPSLGETSVVQKTVEDLAFVEWADTEAPAVAALKGDARMATLVRRALVDRIRPPATDLAFRTSFGVVTVQASASVARRALGRSDIAAKSVTPRLWIQAKICLAW